MAGFYNYKNLQHGVAVFDFATVSGCDQLVVGLTHARGGTLDLLMTDVPAVIRVAVVAPIGNSSLLSVIERSHSDGSPFSKLVC